jgi:hypothetical protein
MGSGEGYLRLGVLDEKRTYPNTDIEWPKWDFGPTSVIPSHSCFITCHSCVGAVAYVRWNLVESKVSSCTKKDPCKY